MDCYVPCIANYIAFLFIFLRPVVGVLAAGALTSSRGFVRACIAVGFDCKKVALGTNCCEGVFARLAVFCGDN